MKRFERGYPLGLPSPYEFVTSVAENLRGRCSMSAFNTVKVEHKCASCGHLVELSVQFKYGEVWQYEYEIGDRLKWGKNNIGQPGNKRVVVDGAAERCPVCHAEGADYEVWLEDDRIVSVQPACGRYDFAACHQTFIVVEI